MVFHAERTHAFKRARGLPISELNNRRTRTLLAHESWQEHQWVDGRSWNDNRALDLIFDNAVVYVEYGQLVTKGDYLARIRQDALRSGWEP